MLTKRIAPCLILDNEKLIHRSRFDDSTDRYIGDPINAVNIFNDYTVDEMFIIDITASKANRNINYNLLRDIAGQAFFPLAYGGGIKNLSDAEKIIGIGYEKVILNSEAIKNPNVLLDINKTIGAQSIVISIDIVFEDLNYYIYNYIDKKPINLDLRLYLKTIQKIGIGEILITLVDLDGTMKGSNTDIIKFLHNEIDVPIIYKGGSSSVEDIKKVISTEVSAFTSSTIFIMKKPNGGIVFNYPTENEKREYGIL